MPKLRKYICIVYIYAWFINITCCCTHRGKAQKQEKKDSGYVSMIIDAAGGAGTVHHPHVKKQVHGEPERATLLKTKSTFVKVHGYGNLIVNNYYTGKQGEKMIKFKPYHFQHDLHAGANLVFDCVLRGLRLVYSKNGNKPITNLYIQLDNTNYNKGYGLLSALASLIQTGVVKKVFYLKDFNRQMLNLFFFCRSKYHISLLAIRTLMWMRSSVQLYHTCAMLIKCPRRNSQRLLATLVAP
jgi:hypothetical protein